MPGSHPPNSTLKTSAEDSQLNSTPVDNGSSLNFSIRFWGVRGSVPTPGQETIRYGGNTVCVEFRIGEKHLIFDGGTGLCAFGKQLLAHMPTEAHLFFTHTQVDRIQGFPFFKPAFVAGNRFHIYGATDLTGASIKQCLSTQMLRPRCPKHIQDMKSELEFCDITPGHAIAIDDIKVEALSLNHTSSALGYRVTWQGKSAVYATDTAPTLGKVNSALIDLAHHADVLICDGTYRWDHPIGIPANNSKPNHHLVSPLWKSGLELAMAAGVKQLVMAYHDPDYSDDSLDTIEAEMQAKLPNSLLAREGLILQIP